MIIPWQQLDSQLLYALLEDIVTRDGTDYGTTEVGTETKVKQLLKQLQTAKATLVWDSVSETGNIINCNDLQNPDILNSLENFDEYE